MPTPAPDALFHLNQRFQEDTVPEKLGLGVGAYRSDEGKPYVLEVVREAEPGAAPRNSRITLFCEIPRKQAKIWHMEDHKN